MWQTLPSPSRFTFTSTVSSSQSTRMSTTCERLPEVSPFVHSVLRVRLKKVAKPVRRVIGQRLLVHEADHQHFALSASWTTAGISPSSFEKSIKTKNPAGSGGAALGPWCLVPGPT